MLDAYTRRARLAPAALAALPAVALLGGSLLAPTRAASIIAMGFGAVGILICGLVRDAGLRLQPGLWGSWGGAPTTRRLRWRDAQDAAQTQRLHDRLNPLLSHPLPTHAEEDADNSGADRRYDEAVAALRERTRDPVRFQLLFAENIEYGFRRNCLGLRPYALAVAAASLLVAAIAIIAIHGAQRTAYIVSAGIALLALIGWQMLVRPDWVKLAAERYSNQLLAAIEQLRLDHP